jgi:hypothetical protein
MKHRHHAACCRMLDQHHERECQRDARKGVGSDSADEKPVERDHAGYRQEVQDVGRGEPQQREENRTFQW